MLFDQQQLNLTLSRLCMEVIENHANFADTVLLGLQPRGIFLAEKIQQKLTALLKKEIPLGWLDVTFFRDDFRKRETPLRANATKVDFIIENKKVILIDDVLYTGRTVRAALDAMQAFGRPSSVELLVLIDRTYTRQLPIQAQYIGKKVNTLSQERIEVEIQEQGYPTDNIWIIENSDHLKPKTT